MADVQLKCGIDGCGREWAVAQKKMKESMAEHRRRFHPGWVPPEPKPMTAYRLDYSGRARQF
jgi:hypothetical protein